MHPADSDIGRSYDDGSILLEPAQPLPWTQYPTRFTIRRGGKSHVGVVNHPHLALLKALKDYRFSSVMDIGCGEGVEAEIFRFLGADVFTINLDLAPGYKADFIGDYIDSKPARQFDLIWCSHVLEHVRNPGAFLDKVFDELKDGGAFVVSVPYNEFNSGPDTITYGHHNRYNALLLLYQLVCAGFDCREASMRIYNGQVSLIVEKRPNGLTKSNMAPWHDLAPFFPWEMHDAGGNCHVAHINWATYHRGGSEISLPPNSVPA